MNRLLRGVGVAMALLTGAAGCLAQLAYEPVAIGWTAAEVERVGAAEISR